MQTSLVLYCYFFSQTFKLILVLYHKYTEDGKINHRKKFIHYALFEKPHSTTADFFKNFFLYRTKEKRFVSVEDEIQRHSLRILYKNLIVKLVNTQTDELNVYLYFIFIRYEGSACIIPYFLLIFLFMLNCLEFYVNGTHSSSCCNSDKSLTYLYTRNSENYV